MSRPDPSKNIAPLIQTKVEIQTFSDEKLIKLEKVLESKVDNAENLNNQRVSAVFNLISQEKSRRGLE